ncbi:minor capsid protein [Halobacillus sp. A5]|uniref:minor capsid protein n=1 Tax=Halobacillus sp. A5 TaxID=2880263 RepID=UPI0020A69125|nr:minor capsid protein [Halobacillus sp. A5]MCP3026604.1 minor capsid protein [Halobacillus sp. A5]
MIQDYLRKELEEAIPDLEWTVDFYTADDYTGTVYNEGGRRPDPYETEMRFPSYMVYIRSSDWSYAQTAAEQVYQALHRKGNFTSKIELYDTQGNVIETKNYHVFFIAAASDPIPVGVNNELMEYSINFDVTLQEIKEESTHVT